VLSNYFGLDYREKVDISKERLVLKLIIDKTFENDHLVTKNTNYSTANAADSKPSSHALNEHSKRS
jgi:hypothetical protein